MSLLIAEGRSIVEVARQEVWTERGMPVDLLPAYGAGIQVHVEHLADYINGRELRSVGTGSAER